MHFAIVTRHLEDYCGEEGPFDFDFGRIQDINKPEIVKCTLEQALRKTLKCYYSDIVVNNFLRGFTSAISEGRDSCALEETILMREPIGDHSQGQIKYRYSLIQHLDNLIIQCIDRELKVPAFPLILAEVFEL